jgi:methionyl-tRNA formyltransferase
MLKREDGKIDWSLSAVEIEQMVRAFDPWPGTWTTLQGKRVKILKTSILSPQVGCTSNSDPGHVWTVNKKMVITCGKGSLVIKKLQFEGKKATNGEECIRN